MARRALAVTADQPLTAAEWRERELRALLEAPFQAQVERDARKLGWAVYHTRDSRRSAAGFPDLILASPPYLVVAELKREGRRPTGNQASWLWYFSVAGVRAYVWRPLDSELISRFLANPKGVAIPPRWLELVVRQEPCRRAEQRTVLELEDAR